MGDEFKCTTVTELIATGNRPFLAGITPTKKVGYS
jgi:hypothetical protein